MPVRHNAILNRYNLTGTSGTFDQNQEMPRALRGSVTSIVVEEVTGSPTVATITPRFHFWHSMVGGNQEEANTSAAGLSPDKAWFPILAAQNPGMLPDGDWPTALDVKAATMTAPIAVFRSLKGGFPWKFSLDWALTGGTSPIIRVSVMTYFDEYPGLGASRDAGAMF